MLFNLDKGNYADQLIYYIQEVASRIVDDKGLHKPDILSTGQKLVKTNDDGITRSYKGELYEKTNKERYIKTHMDWGGENYYSPISTIMFLQYLIRALSNNYLTLLAFVIGGMNKYYTQNDYSKLISLVDAPVYGFKLAQEFFENSRK